MSQGRAKPKKIKCRICGDWFEALKRNVLHCEACRAAIRRAESHAQYRVKTGKIAREDYRAAVEAEVRADVEERRRRENENRPRCLFCGRVYGVDSSGYCTTCRSNGLDSIHKETGRTNGWDMPATVKMKAVGEWRGRPVAGHSIRVMMGGMLEDL